MISVSVDSGYNVLSMTITHDECFEPTVLSDVLDKIEEVYDYIFQRTDMEIRFVIDHRYIETRADGSSIYVYYHSIDIMFERICSRYEIRILDDDSIYLYCFDGDRMVSCVKII